MPRGRPPKNKQPIQSVQPSHDDRLTSPASSPSPTGAGGIHSPQGSKRNIEGGDPDQPSLYLPPVDILKKLIDRGNISKIANIECDPETTEPLDSLTQTDLDPAIYDLLQFKQYITDTKKLVDRQIDTLNNNKNQKKTFKIQRRKYKSTNKYFNQSSSSSSPSIQSSQRGGKSVNRGSKGIKYSGNKRLHSQRDDDPDYEDDENELMDQDDGDDDNDSHSIGGATDDGDGGGTGGGDYVPTTKIIVKSKASKPKATNRNNNNNDDSTTTTSTTTTTTTGSGRLKKKLKYQDYIHEDDDIDIDGNHTMDDDTKPNSKQVLRLTENDDIGLIDDQTITSESDTGTSSIPASVTSTASSRKTAGKNSGKHSKKKGPKSMQHSNSGGDISGDHEQTTASHHKKKKDDDSSSSKAHYVVPGVFWAAMDAYFRNIVDSDLELITPKGEEHYESCFVIPPLGQYYAESWANEDQDKAPSKHRLHKSITNDLESSGTGASGSGGSGTGGGEDGTSLDIYVGDLCQRMLSFLVEENIVTTNPIGSPTNPSNINNNNSSSQADLTKSTSNLALVKPNNLLSTDIPTTTYNTDVQLSLEERIRRELKSLNLYEDYVNTPINNSKHQQHQQQQYEQPDLENDEICAELRLLQSQLVDQVNINNQLKAQAYQACKTLMAKQESYKKKKQFQQNAEKNYQKLLKRDRKKKKKPTYL